MPNADPVYSLQKVEQLHRTGDRGTGNYKRNREKAVADIPWNVFWDVCDPFNSEDVEVVGSKSRPHEIHSVPHRCLR